MLEKGGKVQTGRNVCAGLDASQQARLDKLVTQYKGAPSSFGEKQNAVSTGSVLVRVWRGKKYIVTVHEERFGYEGTSYGSLSRIATLIIGTLERAGLLRTQAGQ